jgi:hypothetical protein
MIIKRLRTSSPPRQATRLSVVSHTLCKMEVLPAFARPIIRTRKLIFGSGQWSFVVPIMETEFGRQESLIEVIWPSISGSGPWSPTDWVVPIGATEFGRQESLAEMISSGWMLIFGRLNPRRGLEFLLPMLFAAGKSGDLPFLVVGFLDRHLSHWKF